MQLLITGARRAGKSIALQRLTASAPHPPGAQCLVASADTEPVQVAADLQRLIALLRPSTPDDRGRAEPAPRTPLLIAIDDVQRFTRDATHGRAIRTALVALCEHAAPDDLLIFACLRAVGALPPTVRLQIDAELTVLGGPFQLRAAGNCRAGRIDLAAPLVMGQLATIDGLYTALNAPNLALRPPSPVVRYEGVSGSGRSYALAQHPTPTDQRRVLLDCQLHSHKGLLVACLRQCGAAADERADIAQLLEAAIVALEARPTLLLLDNVEHASVKTIGTLQQLLSAASAGAFGITPTGSKDASRDRFASLRRRAALIILQPLDETQARMLLNQVAPTLDGASAQLVLQRAQGHPATIAAYAQRVAAHGDDERHQLESYQPPRHWLAVLVLLPVFIALIYAQRHLVENDLIAAVGTSVIMIIVWLLRPRFLRMTRPE